jgi:hypothetical protein
MAKLGLMIGSLLFAAALPIVATEVSGAAPKRAVQAAPAEAAPYQGVVEVSVNGSRMQLERQSSLMPRMNAGIMTLGAGSMFYELKGAASPFRIPSGSNYHFVVRSMGEGSDPSMFFKLFKAEPKKKKFRRIKISQSSLTQGFKMDLERELVPVRFESSRGQIIKIYPQAPLPPGEYAFLLNGNAFAFGVD